jgi:hypothetical protein
VPPQGSGRGAYYAVEVRLGFPLGRGGADVERAAVRPRGQDLAVVELEQGRRGRARRGRARGRGRGGGGAAAAVHPALPAPQRAARQVLPLRGRAPGDAVRGRGRRRRRPEDVGEGRRRGGREEGGRVVVRRERVRLLLAGLLLLRPRWRRLDLLLRLDDNPAEAEVLGPLPLLLSLGAVRPSAPPPPPAGRHIATSEWGTGRGAARALFGGGKGGKGPP